MHEPSAQTDSGRELLSDKVIVSWQGEPLELGRRLNWEAMRGGLGRAQNTLFLGDGAPWIWNLKQDRGANAIELLDFYHASQHCWDVWRTMRGEADPQLTPWMDTRLHWLRHGQEKKVLREIASLKNSLEKLGRLLSGSKATLPGTRDG